VCACVCPPPDRPVWDERQGGPGVLRPPAAGRDGPGEALQRGHGPPHRLGGAQPHRRRLPPHADPAGREEGGGGEGEALLF